MGKITINETAKKSKSVKKPLRSDEAEVISEEADSFDESRARQNSALIVAKPMAQSVRRAGKRSVSGMVMDVAPARAKVKPVMNDVDSDEKAPEKPKKAKKSSEKPEKGNSKAKATIIAVVIALLVGVAGGLLVWFIGRDTTEYCLVQFESSGGSKIASEKIVCGNTVEKPEDPTKEGFEFEEWQLDGKTFRFGVQEVDENVKLVAKWKVSEGTEVVTVTFDSNGGSEVEPQLVAKGKSTTEPVPPTKDGYDFLGWYINGREFDFEQPINEDITVVAAWQKRPDADKKEEKPSSTDDNTKATSLKVSPASKTVKAGEEFELTVSVEPKTAKYNLAVKSTAEDKVSCSTVDAQASTKITCKAVAPGDAKIEIRDQNSNRTVSAEITVKKVDVTGVEFMSDEHIELEVGGTTSLSTKISPSNATNKSMTFSSSDESVATVSESGVVTAKSSGTATITVTTADGGKTARCTITVKDPNEQEQETDDNTQGINLDYTDRRHYR